MKKSHLRPLTLLPPKSGTCQTCAADHPPELPHNQQSLYYQYSFYDQHGRWPTWADAMAHCSESVRTFWSEELARLGQEIT